ncbi:MAG: phosphate acyltransferase [Candidatus Caldatribacteriota bacterium]|nr:phosphate acyltransferase [Candidatus Caldatribacteriota bacterium]
MIKSFKELFTNLKSRGREKIVVAGGEDMETLKALKETYDYGFGEGILVGDKAEINKSLSMFENKSFIKEIIGVKNEQDKARKAVEKVKEGGTLLKGKIKTAILLKAVLNKEWGLRTNKIVSDVFVFEDRREKNPKLVLMSDGGVNLNPEVKVLVSIIENAVEVAHKLGIEVPKVALLAAVETINPDMEETIKAGMISKMNQRKQITGCIIDGPLALDNAISEFAAKKKGIVSPVAGKADILIVPNIAAGNIFGKGLTYYANYQVGHTLLGTSAPVIIPSRADKSEVKLNCIALSVLCSK